MKVEGSVAIVTGGASGLGAAVVRRLAAGGARVVIVDRDGRGQALADELGAQFLQADVTDGPAMEGVVLGAGMLGPLRIVVCCAGVPWAGRVVDKTGTPHDLDVFRRVIEVSLVGSFNTMRLAAAAMMQTEPAEDGERGVIVHTASMAAFDGQTGQTAYAAAKGGIVSMTLPAARDLAPAGIRVLTIAPGTFDTPMMALMAPAAREALAAQIPFPPRMGTPDEFASLVEHAITNRYLNGEVVRIDGALRPAAR